MMLSAAVIGCGLMGSALQDVNGAEKRGICTHAGAYSAHDDVNLVALCDTNSDLLATAGQRWSVTNLVENYQDLLASKQLDLVSIVTPVETHFSIAKDFLEQSSVKAILLEKPVASSVKEAQELENIANQHNKRVYVNYLRRSFPAVVKLKHQFMAGDFGHVIAVNGVYTKGIFHNGTHWLDLFRFLLGEPESIEYAVKWQGGSEDDDGDPHLSFALNHEAIASVNVVNVPNAFYDVFEMDIICQHARILLSEHGDRIEISKVENDSPFAGYRALSTDQVMENQFHDGMYHVIQDVYACVAENEVRHLSTLSNANQNLIWADQIVTAYRDQ